MDLETQLKAILRANNPGAGIENLNAKHAVTPTTASVLYDFVRTIKPARTLEIGMAYGISTLCICQAHRDNGTGAGCHIVDPFQESSFQNIGLASGHVAFDDPWMPGVRSVASFVLKNTSYKLVRASSAHSPTVARRLWALRQRIAQNPLGRDWTLKLVPQNVAILQKVSDERQGWEHHRAF